MTVNPVYFVVSQRLWWVGNAECGSVEREGNLECAGTLKNLNSSPQQFAMMCKCILDVLAEDVMLQLFLNRCL